MSATIEQLRARTGLGGTSAVAVRKKRGTTARTKATKPTPTPKPRALPKARPLPKPRTRVVSKALPVHKPPRLTEADLAHQAKLREIQLRKVAAEAREAEAKADALAIFKSKALDAEIDLLQLLTTDMT